MKSTECTSKWSRKGLPSLGSPPTPAGLAPKEPKLVPVLGFNLSPPVHAPLHPFPLLPLNHPPQSQSTMSPSLVPHYTLPPSPTPGVRERRTEGMRARSRRGGP